MKRNAKPVQIFPGFSLNLGFSLVYTGVLVALPLTALLVSALSLEPGAFWQLVTAPRLLASYRLSFGMALIGSAIDAVFGCLLAFVLVRYRFPLQKWVDALIDLPFALPTAVAGLALTALYSEEGWIGRWLLPLGIKVAFTPLGVLVAMIFIGLPFVVRTVQPVLADLDRSWEEAAATLGASRWQIFYHVILPSLMPALLTGYALALARAIGEYGSVIFIAGNIPFVSEITPLMIISKLEQYDQVGATAIALVMLMIAFVLLLVVHTLQRRARRFQDRK